MARAKLAPPPGAVCGDRHDRARVFRPACESWPIGAPPAGGGPGAGDVAPARRTGAAGPAVTALRRLLRRAGLASAGLGVVAGLGLVWFATPPRVEDRAAATDAIVVLTGGSLRVQSGIDLLREGKGRELFISGVDRRVDQAELLRVSGNGAPSLACCVVLGHHALNTEGNARETAQWMRRQGYRSLRLVTAWYHMPRSRLEFERAMPGISIIAHPVFPERVKQERWWTWHGTATLLIGEYGKYLAALVRPLAGRPQPPEPRPVAQAEIRG